MNIRPVLLLLHALLLASAATLAADARGGGEEFRFTNISYGNAVLWRPKTVADQRIMYGEDRSAVQFADLRRPDDPCRKAGFPVRVFLHGGAWDTAWSKNCSEAPFESALDAQTLVNEDIISDDR